MEKVDIEKNKVRFGLARRHQKGQIWPKLLVANVPTSDINTRIGEQLGHQSDSNVDGMNN